MSIDYSRVLSVSGMLFWLLVCMSSGMATSSENGYRLPKTIAPVHYWISLTPTFAENDFLTTGSVRVLVSCKNATDRVVFNLNGIQVERDSVSLRSEGGREYLVTGQDEDGEKQMYSLFLDRELVPEEKYYLSMKFSYQLNQNLEGFYRSRYTDSQGRTRWLATTQFSPINARRAFPCWDEPSFKALFNISLGRQAGMTSISNMPTFLTAPMEGKKDWFWDHHESTLPVSTYLIAFIVTDLPSHDLSITKDPHFKVWSRPELVEEMQYMGELSPKVLTYIADYFKVPFPLHKIDLFAVPDFGFSAMENWGLITFAETAIKNAKTIAHELAHQWFGNLVTPEWWEDLWLKEGFATFIGITALDGVDGNSNATDKWIVDELHHSMFEDSLWGSHPVSNPVDDPTKIWQAFDAISYEKGSSIIRMMCEFLGEERFREGLYTYLRRFAFGNANREQLWEAFGKVPGIDLAAAMDRWTLQTGYPVLTVHRDHSSPSIHLAQERFLLNGSREDKSIWDIPYTFTYKSDKEQGNNGVSWLTVLEKTHHIPQLNQKDWFLINLNRSGYYRVNYGAENWGFLVEDFWNLPRLSRVQLINDAFNLAIPGRLDYDVPFRLVEKLKDSQDNFIWNVTIVELSNIGRILIGTDLRNDFKKYALSLFHSDNLNYNSENKVLVNFASALGQKDLVQESIQAMQNLMEGKNLSYPEEVRSAVYCNGVRHSGQEVWDFLWGRYQQEKQPEEKKNLLTGLACSQDVDTLERLLEGLLSDKSGIRKQEAKLVFSLVAGNEKGVDLSLEFLIKNWDKIKERFGLGYKIMSTMVLSLGPVLNQQTQFEKVQKLYNDHFHDLGSTSNAFLYTLERTQININWLKNHYQTVEQLIK